MNTHLYLERFCLPDLKEMKDKVMEMFMSDGLSNYMGDLATCWWVFIVMAFISLAISIIYLILLRCFAKPIMYLSFVLILVLLAGGGAYVFA